jgi:hypothetical protein
MIHRQTKLPRARRIIAAGCAAIWLTGVSACNLEALCCCDSPGSETEAHADLEHSRGTNDAGAGTNHTHEADAPHSHNTDGHSQDSHKHGTKEGSCCSTLKAVVPTANPVVFSKLAFHAIPFHCMPLEAHAATLALPESPSNSHAKCWDRVPAPEVCLGPAHRSLAPPAFRLI